VRRAKPGTELLFAGTIAQKAERPSNLPEIKADPRNELLLRMGLPE
jgi:hypothetical protein